MRSLSFVKVAALVFCGIACFGQANGNLQIHHMDVGQGDGAVLISPGGQVVFFDYGMDMVRKDCTKPVAALASLGITQIDYIYISHYHTDHVGCIPAVLQKYPVKQQVFDRGFTYTTVNYKNYVAAVGTHRTTATLGSEIQLDAGSAHPVVIKVVAVDGKSLGGGTVATTNENDLSQAVLVSFGSFREEIGGDLSGEATSSYQDVETPVAPTVGLIDVYKVHHHCSSYSSNDTWLADTKPTVGIISTGTGNTYHHPAADCIARLHAHGLKKVYWTEQGSGESPGAGDVVVGGAITIEVVPGASSYTVSFPGGGPDTYPIQGGSASTPASPPADSPQAGPAKPPVDAGPKYSWSKTSQTYHYSNCSVVATIKKANLQQGDTPPSGKQLHANCPTGVH